DNDVTLLIDPESDLIEVKGENSTGELTLATLLMASDGVFARAFTDSVTHMGGQITVQLIPIQDRRGIVKKTQLEVTYTDRSLLQSVHRITQRVSTGIVGIKGPGDRGLSTANAWVAKAAIALTLIVSA